MNIEIAAICDAATANGIGGRLNILGAFDRVFPAKFPFVIPQCAAAFRIRYQRAETGTHKLALSIEDVCGHPIVPVMESNIPFEPVATGLDTAAINLVLNMQRLHINLTHLDLWLQRESVALFEQSAILKNNSITAINHILGRLAKTAAGINVTANHTGTLLGKQRLKISMLTN